VEKLGVEAKLALENVVKKFGDTVALGGISFEVHEGEFFTIIGPSGCGKTTTLRCIVGLETPDSGSVYLDGRDVVGVPPYKRNISLVFQDLALFPHMNVFDNIAFGLRMKGLPKNEIKKEVEEVMKLVRLEGLGNRNIESLSRGQQQRVALARSLVTKPSVILFDEPIASLDLKLREKMLVELKSLHRELGFTGIYVTHEQYQAMILADRIMVMNKGHVEQIGPPQEVYANPKNVFVAVFIGTTNLIKCTINALNEKKVTVETNLGKLEAPLCECKPGMRAVYTVRPENIMMGEAAKHCDNKLKARLASEMYGGGEVYYTFQLPNHQEFKAIMEKETLEAKIGEEVIIGWRTEDARLITESSVVPGIDIDDVILGE
jgi:spermidine/putrescine transport system ATP-binding protein